MCFRVRQNKAECTVLCGCYLSNLRSILNEATAGFSLIETDCNLEKYTHLNKNFPTLLVFGINKTLIHIHGSYFKNFSALIYFFNL